MQHQDQDNQHDQLIQTIHQFKKRQQQRINYFQQIQEHLLKMTNNHNSPLSSSLPSLIIGSQQQQQQQRQAPSPPPPPPTPPPPPSPPPPQREFRARKPNQVKPFTIETKAYINKLYHNGWEDAVVKNPKLKNHRTDPPSPALSINSNQSEQQERSDSSEIELPQLSQLCPRKFHNKPTQLNSKHHNQPHHRRAQSSDPQSPSARKNNPSLRTTTTTHIQQTPPIIRFPSTSTLINTPSQQSLPSPLPPSPSIIFQSNPPSPLQSTSRKRTTSLQNQPNPKRHSRHRSPQSRAPSEPGDPSDNQSNDLSNQHSNRRSFSANTIKPSNRGKSKATVVNPSKGSTRAKIRSRSDDDQRRDQDREEEDENEEEEEELDQLLTLRKKDLKIMNRMMPRAAALKAHDDMILMFREDRTQKLRKTIHSDSHHQQPQAQPQQKKQRATSARSLSPPEESTTGYSPDHQRTQQEPNGMNWGKRMRMRISRSSSSTSQLLNSSRTLERSTSHSSSVTSNPSSRTTRAVSQSSRTNRLNRAISLRDDHALWRTYESANGRPALNLPPPAWRQHSVVDDKTEIELTQVPIWDFKDFTSDFGISRLPANLMITSQVNYLSDGHISELISLLDSSSLYATIKPVEIFETSFSGFMTLEEWQQPLSSVADRIQDELSAWLAEDSGRSKNALSETGRWFKFMGRSINSVGFDDRLVEPMLDWIEDLLARIDDLAVDAVNRPEFSNLMLVTSWGIFELVVRLGLHCRRRPLDSTRSPQTLLEFGHRSLSNLLRRLLEYGPPVTMGKLKAYSSDDDRESPLFDISVEVWAALLNIILTPIDDGSKAEYLLIDSFWTKVIDNTQIHAQQIELSQIACGEAVSYLSMMLCAISQILPSGQTTEAGRMKAHWPVLVVSLGKIPETILGEMLEVRMRERRDRYVRSLFARILVFHERWDWELCFDDGMVERLYKILNAGRFERLSIELPEMNQRFGPVDRFPHLLDDIDPDELKQIPSSEDLAFRLSTKMRTDDSCFGIFLKILIVGFKALPRPIEASKQKEIEKIISRCNPLRQLSFKPSRDLGPTDPKITEQNRTSLVNHCALFLIYSILFPNTLKRQWSFLCNLYSFASIDHPARSTHFKILCHFAKFLKPPLSSTGIVQRFGQFEYLKIILKKFSENLTLLKLEYSKLKERESMIQGRLFGSSTVSSGGASTTASSKDIFKKDSAEHVTLRVELKEISEAINSRVQLVTQIFDSLFDIFSFYSHDLSRQDHSLIYPPLFWLDSSWSVGIEESILMREKLVICGFNKLVYALLDRRKMKMAQVVEDERRVEAIEVRIGEACRVVAADREELADDELVLQKSELKEQIEAVYALDQEFVERAVSVLPGPLTKSIQSLILDRHQGALDEHQLGFFPVGVQSIRLLGCIDRLKAALDPGFNWLENFRSVERQLGEFGASRPSNPPQSKGKTVSNNGLKKRNEIKMMTVAMSGMMSYLIGNLAGYFEEATHLSQPREASSSSSKTMTALTRIYRGQVRLEVLKVWIDSLTFIEYSLQLPFSNLIIHLENDLSVLLASHPGQPNDELYGTFVPSVDDWNCWLVLNRILEPADRAHLGPEWSLDKELDFVFNLCSSDRASATLTLESKRIEVFELIFGEMKKQLIHLTRGPTEGGEKIEMEKYVELYKEIIGRFAESISTLNRRLVVFIASSTDADHLRLKVGLENLVMTWKTSVKSIFHNFLPLNNRPDSAPHNPDQSGLHLDQFFNFDSFPKLRILKSILGIV